METTVANRYSGRSIQHAEDLIAKSIDDLIAAAIVELPTPLPSLLPSLEIVLKIPQTHEGCHRGT